jgi:hypothetical protein
VGVDDAHFNGDCYRSAAVDSLDEHVSATHLGIDAETLHDETVFADLGVDRDRGLGEKAAGSVGMGGFGRYPLRLLVVVGAGLHQRDEEIGSDDGVPPFVHLASPRCADPVEDTASDVEFVVDDLRVLGEECSGDLHVLILPTLAWPSYDCGSPGPRPSALIASRS